MDLETRARKVDRFDRITGPLSMLLEYSGIDELEGLGIALNLIEIAVVKTPFLIQAYRQTKDLAGIVSLYGPKEVLGTLVPWARVIDIAPIYTMRTNYLLHKRNI